MPFRIYRSSAGSGKTFTLVKEFLRIALRTGNEAAYRGILAITFTNKAAEEMRGRVLDTLHQLSQPGTADAMAQVLQQELGISAEVLSGRAGQVLRHMLHNYSDLSISTIDSFTHRILRIFAHDLGLQPDFAIDLDTERMAAEMADRLLALTGSEQGVTDALIDLVLRQAEDERSWSIDSELRTMALTVFREESRFHLESLRSMALSDFVAMRRDMVNAAGRDKEELRTMAAHAMAQMGAAGIGPEHIAGGKNGVGGFIQQLAQGAVKLPTATAAKNIEGNNWHSSKAKAAERSAVDGIKQQLEEVYHRAVSMAGHILVKELVLRHVYGIALLDRLLALQREIQEEAGSLHIGEFNHIVGNVVMREQAPFIYERLGSRYHHLLIDEFQDTSVMQWLNLLPLAEESLATDGLVLVVGDAKQSIYRWRGGEVQQFVRLPDVHRTAFMEERLEGDGALRESLGSREELLRLHAEEQALDFNFRTLPEVVRFNNDLFTDLRHDMPPDLQGMYDRCAQHPRPGRSGGSVALRFFRNEAGGRSDPMYHSATLAQVSLWVEECLTDGYLPGDIAILCRSNRHTTLIAQHLIGEGRRVVSGDSLLIHSAAEVRLLVNAATFLIAPDNSINSAELVQHLCMVRGERHLSAERLAMAGRSRDGHAVMHLLRQLCPGLHWEGLRSTDLYGIFDRLAHHLLPDRSIDHVRYLLDEVIAYTRLHGSDLHGFLGHWAEVRAKRSIALSEDAQAIRILTVHKSKGLEFPVVIHPFADYGNSPSDNRIWLRTHGLGYGPGRIYPRASKTDLVGTPFEDSYLQEHAHTTMDMFNMLYVALTRPRERLYVAARVRKEEESKPDCTEAGQFVFRSLRRRGLDLGEHLSLTIGQRQPPCSPHPTQRAVIAIPCLGHPDWHGRIAIARPSANERSDNAARQLGILTHGALARILTAEDVQPSVRQLVEEGAISEGDAATLEQRIRRIMALPQLAALFAPGAAVRNEADILLPATGWLRPDRVVTHDGGATVIDYKTGDPRPEHLRQVGDYKDALAQLGFSPVRGMLVYLEREEAVEV